MCLNGQCHEIFDPFLFKKTVRVPESHMNGIAIFFVFRENRVSGLHVVVDSQVREFLHEKEKVRETVLACLYGAQVESFEQKMYTIS